MVCPVVESRVKLERRRRKRRKGEGREAASSQNDVGKYRYYH